MALNIEVGFKSEEFLRRKEEARTNPNFKPIDLFVLEYVPLSILHQACLDLQKLAEILKEK